VVLLELDRDTTQKAILVPRSVETCQLMGKPVPTIACMRRVFSITGSLGIAVRGYKLRCVVMPGIAGLRSAYELRLRPGPACHHIAHTACPVGELDRLEPQTMCRTFSSDFSPEAKDSANIGRAKRLEQLLLIPPQ